MSHIVDHFVLNMIPPILVRYSGRVTPWLTPRHRWGTTAYTPRADRLRDRSSLWIIHLLFYVSFLKHMHYNCDVNVFMDHKKFTKRSNSELYRRCRIQGPWQRSCPAWWRSAAMHLGHLAPTYHQSMAYFALIEVRIVAQLHPKPADGDHGKHDSEQDDVNQAFDGFTR